MRELFCRDYYERKETSIHASYWYLVKIEIGLLFSIWASRKAWHPVAKHTLHHLFLLQQPFLEISVPSRSKIYFYESAICTQYFNSESFHLFLGSHIWVFYWPFYKYLFILKMCFWFLVITLSNDDSLKIFGNFFKYYFIFYKGICHTIKKR